VAEKYYFDEYEEERKIEFVVGGYKNDKILGKFKGSSTNFRDQRPVC
jgi:hypothetical protein